jgi:hypothetical protein
MKRSYLTRNFILVLSLASTLLAAGCKKKDEAPHYTFTTAQLEWAKPYQTNAVWSFVDDQGNLRRYQPSMYNTQEIPIGSANLSETAFYRQLAISVVARTDSTMTFMDPTDARQRKYFMNMAMGAAVDADRRVNNEVFEVNLIWSNTLLELPAHALENGEAMPTNWRLLPTATFGSATYDNVLEYTAPAPAVGITRFPWDAVKVYYVSNRGVVSFTERGGTTWNRY